jgi:hypothetical protein
MFFRNGAGGAGARGSAAMELRRESEIHRRVSTRSPRSLCAAKGRALPIASGIRVIRGNTLQRE